MSETKLDPVPMFSPTRHFNENKPVYMEHLNSVFEHGYFINGPEIKELEEKLAKYVNTKHAIGVSSGTDALLVALMAVGITNIDEVVTVPFTWISTAEVIKLLGAKPIFCDIDKNSFNIDPQSLKTVITEKTKVVMPVSIFGQMYDVKGIETVVREAEKKYGTKIYIIEDAAQSFGSTDNKGRKSCSVGDIGCTSFFPSKPLGCFGDGGMCFTNDDDLALKMKMIKSHGCFKRYDYRCVGINGRLDTLQAAVLLAKYPDFEKSLHDRIVNAEVYSLAFSDLPVHTPEKAECCGRHVYAQYTLQLKDEKTCSALLSYLKERKIGCGRFYPVCLHLVDAITSDYEKGSFPVSEDLAKRVLSIPVYSDLKEEERNNVINHIQTFFTN